MLELMASRGEVAVAGRKGRERLWDLASRVRSFPAGYVALPVLYEDRLVGKVDATADRRDGVLRVNAVHEDVPFSRAMTAAISGEIEDLARWLGLDLAS